METVVVVIHLMVIVALVALVLMQRSEGGALGIGGSGNFLSTRSQGNVLTRSTAIVAAAFFATSIILSVLGRFGEKPTSILQHVQSQAPITAPAGSAGGGAPAAAGGAANLPATGGPALPSGAAPAVPASGGAVPATPNAGGAGAAPAAPQVPTSQ